MDNAWLYRCHRNFCILIGLLALRLKLHEITSFCMELQSSCTALVQSESSNFFMYLIIVNVRSSLTLIKYCNFTVMAAAAANFISVFNILNSVNLTFIVAFPSSGRGGKKRGNLWVPVFNLVNATKLAVLPATVTIIYKIIKFISLLQCSIEYGKQINHILHTVFSVSRQSSLWASYCWVSPDVMAAMLVYS